VFTLGHDGTGSRIRIAHWLYRVRLAELSWEVVLGRSERSQPACSAEAKASRSTVRRKRNIRYQASNLLTVFYIAAHSQEVEHQVRLQLDAIYGDASTFRYRVP
jgi:hypothetical protein